jgi:xanthosine utilization system XapX-like protein
MQTRLLACGAGGFSGVALTSVINASLGLPPTLALVGCALAGVGIGYAVSTLIHVFTASPNHELSPAPVSASNRKPNN